MTGFNFNSKDSEIYASVENSGGGKMLKANTIHDCFVSDVSTRIISTTNNGNQKVVDVVFSNEEGKSITDTIWEPRSEERKSTVKDGKVTVQASDWDTFNFKIRLYAKVFAPKFYALLRDGKVPNIPSWDKMTEMLVKSFGEGVTNKTMFKLKVLDRESADGKFYPQIPRYFLLSTERDGKLQFFISNRYIGNENEVKFSDWELKKIKEKNDIRPTAPDSQDYAGMVPGEVQAPLANDSEDINAFLNSL